MSCVTLPVRAQIQGWRRGPTPVPAGDLAVPELGRRWQVGLYNRAWT